MKSQVEVGSRWAIWGTVRRVVEIKEYRPSDGDFGPWAETVREGDDPATGKPWKRHWTDLVLVRALINHGVFLREDEAAPAPTHKSLADRIVAEEGKRHAPLTPLRRAANRVTSLRYKIKHPEKHGMAAWSPADLAQLQADLTEAEAERDRLKEGS